MKLASCRAHTLLSSSGYQMFFSRKTPSSLNPHFLYRLRAAAFENSVLSSTSQHPRSLQASTAATINSAATPFPRDSLVTTSSSMNAEEPGCNSVLRIETVIRPTTLPSTSASNRIYCSWFTMNFRFSSPALASIPSVRRRDSDNSFINPMMHGKSETAAFRTIRLFISIQEKISPKRYLTTREPGPFIEPVIDPPYTSFSIIL